MHRGWHNMTARFNGYYYSNENIKETVKKIEKVNKDDFSKIIPLFIYTNNTTSKTFYSDCDKTIKKSSVVIQRHTITERKSKKEIPNACKWIDENYVLIGKAHFYKRDLFSALEAFEYVSKIYPNPEAKYTGMLWMMRTNNEIGSYSLTEASLDEIRNATDFPNDRSYQRELAAVTADYHIKREDYNASIKHLTKAIALTRKKTTKARYTYVLAQVYEKLGDNKKASHYYSLVPGLHPSYDMAFNAQINRAKLYDISEGGSKIIKKQLNKMLRDDKNIEFQDQIYYALADIAVKENDVPLALTYLSKSIKASTSNNTQKALSYLKRADIYFEKPDYKNAQANYDSTMTFLPKDYVDYAVIEEKKKSLTALVVNLNVIVLEDSLQRLGKMSESEREKTIENMITKIEEEEKRKEEERLFQLTNAQNNVTPTNNENANAGSSAWYFYNPATVSFGAGAFTKKWGSRKLEDNWRRSEKDVVGSIVDEGVNDLSDSAQTLNGGTSLASKTKNKKDKNYYLKNIPLTPDAFAKSNMKIVEAYYNVGSIYKEQLLNNQKSVESFEELLQRFPENKYKLTSYYQLYRIYLSMNNQPKSDYYKNLLLKDYPDSDYATIIRNPSYAADIAASKSQVEKFYTETYQLYTVADYNKAYQNCMRADSLYSKSNLMPQFTFLKALCIGRTQDITAFENALTQVTVKYPKDPVKEKAQEMLDMIKQQKNPTTVTTVDSTSNITTPKNPVKFIFNEDGEYYCLVIVENGKGDLNKFKTKLSDFNTQMFSTADISISSVFLDITHQMVNVKTFEGKDKAMNYFDALVAKKELFTDLEKGSYQTFVISAENYTVFYKDKNIVEYEQFFTQNFK